MYKFPLPLTADDLSVKEKEWLHECVVEFYVKLSWYFIFCLLLGCWSYCLLVTTYTGSRLSSQNVTVNSWGTSLHGPKQIGSWFTTSSNLCFGWSFCIELISKQWYCICRFLEITCTLGQRGYSIFSLTYQLQCYKIQGNLIILIKSWREPSAFLPDRVCIIK